MGGFVSGKLPERREKVCVQLTSGRKLGGEVGTEPWTEQEPGDRGVRRLEQALPH